MKILKTFEEFTSGLNNVKEEAVSPGKDSKVVIDDITLDSGETIKSTEIAGVIVSSQSEKEFLDYFYKAYGNGAFTESDMGELKVYYNEYAEEINAAEVEKEEAEKPKEEDPFADL
jgi:hypothetical protein